MTQKDRIVTAAKEHDWVPEHMKYVESLTEEQAKCITSYWDHPTDHHQPHVESKNLYERTFQFLGLKPKDPLVSLLFGSGFK